MDTNFFENIVDEHSLAPQDLLYNGNALAGETGEVCNNIKKISMATRRPEWTQVGENALLTPEHFIPKTADELGDSLFYLTRVAHDLGFTLNQIMLLQIGKLKMQDEKYERVFLK